MRAAAKALRLLPVLLIGLVTLLWPPVTATATMLEVHAKVNVPPKEGAKPKAPAQEGAKPKVPPQKGPKQKDERKAHKKDRPNDDVLGLGVDVDVSEDEDESPSSVTIVTPIGPAASIQLPAATPPPAASVPETEPGGATGGSSPSQRPDQAATPPARGTKARSKRTQGRATASSTPRSLSSPSGAAPAASLDGRSNTSSRAGRREPKPDGQARRSVVERIVDRVPTAYRLGLLAAIAVAGGFALATIRERRRARRAEAEAQVDPLTGLANRRAFDRRLAEEWERSQRYGHPLGVLMLDLDGFKQINDTRGHKEGDRILREAAARIANRLRTVDLAARYGGDEFAAICPETEDEGLESLALSLERCLAGLPVGASIGIAARRPEDENPLDLLERADAAMYREKQSHNGDPALGIIRSLRSRT
jgi:diguanylate cyclase (GGDEF)-like protein